jgi:hypothetical protein
MPSNDLDAVAVWIMEISVASGKGLVPLVGIFDYLDIARVEDCERAVEFLRFDHERVMMRVLARPVRIYMMGHFREHEIAVAALHE